MSSSVDAIPAPRARAAAIGPAPAELRRASVAYDGTIALDTVDLVLEPGRVTVLLGPNGAGKTSAVKLLLGLLAPASGTARVFGRDPRTLAARRRIGVMMQVAKVPETLRVVEHIDTFRSYYPQPLERAALIDAAGLQGLERRLYGTLSGGEQQRVLFALALAGDPALLFLDEPTVGMDVSTRRAFWSRIRALRDQGRAVLLTTHYLEEADALADRIVVLDRGRVVADGPPAEVKRSVPRRRIQCRTRLPLEHVQKLAGVQSAQWRDDTMVVLAADAENVVRAMLAEDPTLDQLEVAGASLEDAFLALTPARGGTDAGIGRGGHRP
jgi:ABC-2 type transport system ATP-binding protein